MLPQKAFLNLIVTFSKYPYSNFQSIMLQIKETDLYIDNYCRKYEENHSYKYDILYLKYDIRQVPFSGNFQFWDIFFSETDTHKKHFLKTTFSDSEELKNKLSSVNNSKLEIRFDLIPFLFPRSQYST